MSGRKENRVSRNARRGVLVAATAFVVSAASTASTAHGQLSVTSDTPYVIDFDNTVPGVNNGTFAGSGFEPGAPTPGRLDSNAWAVTGWSDGALAFGGTQNTSSTDYARGSSSSQVTTSGMWGFTIAGSGRALGIQQGISDWDPGTLTLRVQNSSGQSITGFDFAYKLWWRNDQLRSTTVTLSLSQDDSSYTNVAGTNTSFSTPSTADTNGMTATNASANISGLSIAPGGFAYLRWSGSSSGPSGARDEIAFDNITLNHFTFGVAPTSLVWNSFPGGTWNTTPGNQPWLKNASPSAFAAGDSVVFDEPASTTTVAIDAAGVSPNSVVFNNAGNTYTFTGGAIHASANLVKNNAGSVVFANTNGWTGGGIVINAGSVVIAQNGSSSGAVKINGGLTLSTANGARFDIKDNHLIITGTSVGTWNGSAYTGVTGLVASGRASDGVPLWDGAGIVTSMSEATAGNYTSIGVARASDVRPSTATATESWAGQAISGNDTLVMYTYGGDATLDGKINIDDYVRIDNGISAGLTGWSNGDFNYDGKINIDDYTTIIDANIGTQNGVFFTSEGMGNIDGHVSSVPEPIAGLTVFGLLAPFVRRRKGAGPCRSGRTAR
jgi:hypothetical protein